MAVSFDDFNQQSMVDFLAKLGYFPKAKVGGKFKYHSVLRNNDASPSFSVYHYNGKDVFYDFGTGQSGDMVGLCVSYFGISKKELYQRINTPGHFLFFDKPNICKSIANQKEKIRESIQENYTYKSLKLTHLLLLDYLKERGIADQLLISKLLKEIHITYPNGKNYYMIGFANDKGGFAVRNKYFKGNVGPMGTTIIKRFEGLQKIIVMEGFMDAMSFLSCEKQHSEKLPSFAKNADILVLNSIVNLSKTLDVIGEYSCRILMLDNDRGAIDAKEKIKQSGTQYIDGSGLYKSHKDLNEWWQLEIKTSKESIKKSRKRGFNL